MGYKDPPKEHQFKPGHCYNPKGRPKGKTMKEYAREFLMSMGDEAKLKFLNSLSKETVWKMAEGNPHQDTNLDANVSMPFIIKLIKDDGSTTTRESN